MIGLCGAHRVGKSTLAAAFAKKHDVTLVQPEVSQIHRELGLDPKVDYPFEVRMTIQDAILKHLVECYRKAGVAFVTDRTPLCALAYTFADVRSSNVQGKGLQWFEAYTYACFKAVNEHFTNLVVVQPGLPLIQDKPGSAVMNAAYIEKLNSLILGFVASERCEVAHFYIPREILDLDRRVSCIETAHKTVVTRHQDRIAILKESGTVFH